MKAKLLTILIFLLLIQLKTYSQKFRSLEQYQAYFIENSLTIDDIEGIWYVYLNNKVYFNMKIDEQPRDPPKGFMVAIIKEEKNEYYQYLIENGYYKPMPGYKKFNKISTFEDPFKSLSSGYVCTEHTLIQYEDRCNITMSSITFYIYNDKFTYNLNATRLFNCMANEELASNVKKEYSYSKMFPLESDINANKNQEKSKSTTGTGFAISSDGYIVTNYHVIENATTIDIKGVNGSFSKSHSAKVVLSDKNNDLTILKIDDYTFNSLGTIPYIRKSASSNVGENIFTLGYPLTATMGEEIKLTNGIISSKSGFQGDITAYQVTAPVQPGNSGAPLFDKDGYLIGIINAKHFGAENAGYAIKSNYLHNLIDSAPDKIALPNVNTLKGKPLTEQVNIIKKFVYIIEVN